jgi:WD40 repeat protein
MSESLKIDPTKTHVMLEHKHTRPLTACRFDSLGRYVFFGAEDNLVHRFDIAAKTTTSLAAHDSWVRAIGFSPSGEFLYTGGYDGRLVWWPAADERPQPMRAVEAHQGWIRALAVSPDGQQIATCGNDNLVKVWDAADGKCVGELAGHGSHVYHVAFQPDGQALVSCDLKGGLKEWDAASGSLKRDLTPATALYKYDTTFRADIGGARSIAFRSDGKQLALGGITNVTNAFAGIGEIAVVLVDVADGKIALQLEAKEKIRGVAWGVAHHPEGIWIGLSGGGGGGWLYFWKGDTPQEFFKLKLANDGRDMALSPDAARVAVAHADGNLRIYALHDKAAS